MTTSWKRQLGLGRNERAEPAPAIEPLPVALDLATVVALHQRTHDRRTARLAFEWRLTLAIWAALLLTALFAFEPVSVASALQESRWMVVAIGAGSVLLVALHWWYLATVAEAMDADRSDALRLEHLAGLPSAPAPAPPSGVESAGRWLQVCVTALLAALVVLAAGAAAPPLPCTTVTQAAPTGSTTTITCPSPAGST